MRGWKNSQQLCKPLTLTLVCITVLNCPSPSPVYTSDANTENIPRLITLTKTLIISDLTKTESNNTVIIKILFLFHFVSKKIMSNTTWGGLVLEIMHCICKLQSSQLSAGCSLRLLANEKIVCVCNIITIIITITVI